MADAHISKNRNMTVAEYQLWDKGQCPHCKSTEFYMGSRGGIMRNVECTKCGMKLNVFDPKEFSSTLPGFAQVLHEPVGYVQPDAISMSKWMNGLFGLRKAAKAAFLRTGNRNV